MSNNREKGTFNFSSNFETQIQAPLDARITVKTYDSLIDASTWVDFQGNVWLYDGIIVSVTADTSDARNGAYFLTNANLFEDVSAWKKVGTDISAVPIIENIGIGSGYIFKDSSNNIVKLRTIRGSGLLDVSTGEDYITISVDASYAGVDEAFNLGTGDASIYINRTLNDLNFRTLKGSDKVILSYADENTIKIDVSIEQSKDASINELYQIIANDVSSIDASINYLYVQSASEGHYRTSIDPSLAMPTSVGGIPAGTTASQLYNKTFTYLFDSLLFPTVYPTLNAPYNAISKSSNSLDVIGNTTNITITSSFNRGSIYVGASFQNYRSGLPTYYDYTDPSSNTLLIDTSSNSLTNVQTINGYVIKIGNQSFSSRVSYGIGPQPYDSKGNAYSTPLAAGTTGFQTTSIEGVYPLYATTSNISYTTQQSLISMLSGNSIAFSLVSESGGYKQVFEIPNNWLSTPTNRPLIGVQQYNTVSAQWEYPGGNAAASLLLWNTTATTKLFYGNTINYTKYTYNGTDRAAVQIRLIF